jgi:nitrogen fixation protein NifZ
MPKFEWGQQVIANAPLFNDGSYPECAVDELLVAQGAKGEIVQIGRHVEMDIPVYMVAFPDNRILGCLEEEIIPA